MTCTDEVTPKWSERQWRLCVSCSSSHFPACWYLVPGCLKAQIQLTACVRVSMRERVDIQKDKVIIGASKCVSGLLYLVY